MFRQAGSSSGSFCAFVLVTALAVLAGGPTQGRAADLDKLDASLKEMPADASFYVALLRNREQVDIVRKSRAWAKIKDMPAFKLAWQAAQDEYSKDEGKLAGLRTFYEQEENKDLVGPVGGW